jgi:Na+-translocating ferredoxin:NAD+ oxidoreductase subunit E
MSKNKKGRTRVQSGNVEKQTDMAQTKENADVINDGSAEKFQKVDTDIETDEKYQQDNAAVPEQEILIKMETDVPEQSDIGLLQNAKERVLSVNPVFVNAIAVVPILGAATSLKSGVMLSGAMFLTVVLLNLVMYPLYRIIPRSYRFAASFVAAGAVITPIYMLSNYLAPTVAMLCSIYLPLIAVCAVPMIEKKHYGQKFGIAKTMLDAVLDGVGFAFAAILFSIIREIIGSGKLYDRSLPYGLKMKFSFALLPAGAFLLLGLLVALFRKIYGTNNDGGGKTK